MLGGSFALGEYKDADVDIHVNVGAVATFVAGGVVGAVRVAVVGPAVLRRAVPRSAAGARPLRCPCPARPSHPSAPEL